MGDSMRIRIGTWIATPSLNSVEGDGVATRLEPRAMNLLVYLAEHAGSVVSIDQLITDVWRGSVVNDGSVYLAVSQLRQALGRGYIETVRKRGYRLTAPVEPVHVAPSATSVAIDRSIVVLPFVNMSSDREQEYFSDGLSEEIRNELGRLPDLQVIGRTSSLALKGKREDLRSIGRTLGVAYILEGSVRKGGDRLRITVRLIGASDGAQLWSEAYERTLADVFEVQTDIATMVATALHATFALRDIGERGTRDFAAYDAFLAGLSARQTFWRGDAILEAIAHFERAVEIDPNFDTAWIALAEVAGVAAGNSAVEHRSEFGDKRSKALKKAAELAPNSVQLRLLLADRANDLGEIERLSESIRDSRGLSGIGVQLSVNYAMFLMGVGRPREAIQYLARAKQIDPLSAEPSFFLTLAYELGGDYDEAERESRRFVSVAADEAGYVPVNALLRAMGRRDGDAVKEIARNVATGPSEYAAFAATMLPLLDDRPAALRELRRFVRGPDGCRGFHGLNAVAHWAAYFDDCETAIEAIRKIPRDARRLALHSLWRPNLHGVRRTAAFKDLVRELGLVHYWRATGKWGDFCRPIDHDDFECA
jgi:TolB-like protein